MRICVVTILTNQKTDSAPLSGFQWWREYVALGVIGVTKDETASVFISRHQIKKRIGKYLEWAALELQGPNNNLKRE